MVKKYLLRVIQVTFILLFALQPQTLFAQQAEENCNEARLRNLGIAIVGCKENPVDNSACGGALVGSDNAEKVWHYFIAKGLQPHQAAGFMGNMKAEAHFEPRLVEYGFKNSRGEISKAGEPSSLDDVVPPDTNKNGQPGYGLIQWTFPSRKQGLRDFSLAANKQASDLELQLDYMWSELNAGYKASTLDPVMTATTSDQATDIVMENYERPGDMAKQRPIRRNFAKEFLALYGSGTPSAPSSSGCQLDASGCPKEPISQSETVDASGIRVHPCIADEVNRIVALAHQQGLSTFKGGGYRDSAGQIEARKRNGCPDIYQSPPSSCRTPTAIPGQSNHERGTAVDFECDGGTFSSRTHPCYKFLEANTKLINLPSEAWHWSIDGG